MKTDLKSLQFHLTNRCNLACNFCWKTHDHPQSVKDIEDERFLSLCEDACELKPEEITISGGGEPLLRGSLFLKMAKKIKKSGIRGNLITNGTLLERNVVSDLVELKWDEVIYSIQGPDQRTDDNVRGVKGAFEKTLQSTRALNEVKEEESTSFPKTRFQVVLTNSNSENLENYLELAKEMEVDIINFRLVNERGETLSPKTDESFVRKIRKCEELSEEYGIDFRKEFSLDEETTDEGRPFCEKPFGELVVFADGRVSPCCRLFDETSSNEIPKVGSKSLDEVWHGEKFQRLREMFNQNTPPEICDRCFENNTRSE